MIVIPNDLLDTELEKPSWGITGDNNEEITRHIMCCQGAPYIDSLTLTLPSASVPDVSPSINETDDTAGPSLVILPDQPMTNMEVEVLDSHHPVWFDTGAGWTGTTYDDARAFCESHDSVGGGTLHLCPLSAFCPDGPTNTEPLYLQMDAFEGVQWSPISNSFNGWVMVGKFDDEDPLTCLTHMQMFDHNPGWGLDGSRPELKGHLLCCEDYTAYDDVPPEVEISDSATNEDGNASDGSSSTTTGTVSTSDAGTSDVEPTSISMTALEAQTHNEHAPAWLNSDFGWQGTTYDDAKAFCETISDGTRHLCPLSAYCPNGPLDIKPLYLYLNAFEGVQWAPISDSVNAWVMVGKIDDEDPLTCVTHMQMFNHDPGWGLDGSRPELKEHILCCDDDSDNDNFLPDSSINEDSSTETAADSAVSSLAVTNTDGTVSTSDSGASEEELTSSMTKIDIQIQDVHHPTWFSNDLGWQGTTYDGAKIFCESIPHGDGTLHLCPLIAYCPNGPPAVHPLYLQADAFEGLQWAPISDRYNSWVMVGKFDEDDPLTCLPFHRIFYSDPSWGLDGSRPDLKEHILCCEGITSSDAANGGGGDAGSFVDSDSPNGNSEGSHEGSVMANAGKHTLEASIMNMFKPVWFNADQGSWDGGSHDDAVNFCEQFTGSHGKSMELCPYHAYCPQGPSNPVIGGHDADFNEVGEQWAPVYGQTNHWVLIGKRGTNLSTTCLSHVQLSGEEPSWGLDGSNKEMKKYVMCCSPS